MTAMGVTTRCTPRTALLGCAEQCVWPRWRQLGWLSGVEGLHSFKQHPAATPTHQYPNMHAGMAGGGGEGDSGKVAQFVSNASFATLTLIYTFTELLDLSDKVKGQAGCVWAFRWPSSFLWA